ncbi:MAG: response regulator, partial [Syntrophobacteraceae bacterium]
ENVFSRQIKRLLIIEDDKNLRESIMKLVGNGDVHTDEAATASEAMKAIKSESYDCMILDLGLPDMSGLEMLKLLSANVEIAVPPVIVYTGRELTQEEESELRRYSDSIIVKGVRSEERLFDETSLFLHRLVERMPSHKKRIITDLHDSDSVFREKRILIVDDDMRNVFALSSVLEERGMKTAKAENGRKALDLLDNSPDFDLVVLDIMMPVMDGYEAIRRIRTRERFARLPVIALTAKAMKQDRERCIAAGASDYLTKPVDLDRLLSMMRVWLYR